MDIFQSSSILENLGEQNDKDWNLVGRKNSNIIKTLPARHLWDKIASAAWACADPGVQFDTNINDWHTCPQSGTINASNPCSEYMHLDNSACNLASLNLLTFLNPSGEFDIDAYKKAIRTFIIAQDIPSL